MIGRRIARGRSIQIRIECSSKIEDQRTGLQLTNRAISSPVDGVIRARGDRGADRSDFANLETRDRSCLTTFRAHRVSEAGFAAHGKRDRLFRFRSAEVIDLLAESEAVQGSRLAGHRTRKLQIEGTVRVCTVR